MSEIVSIPISDLLLDGTNPRQVDEQSGQQEAALSLASQQGPLLVKLAEDIVRNGTDPTTLIGVVAVGDTNKRYRVIEGNRRLLAIKALETPSLISAALSPRDARKFARLSGDWARNPLQELPCVLFKVEDEAGHWIELRHTGQNQGSGLVEWASTEKDRYKARHAGRRSPAGQVIEFVEQRGSLSADARSSNVGILTNLERLLSSPDARLALGIDIVQGEVIALHDADAISKSLTRVVEDLKIGRVKVPDIYNAEHRKAYAQGLPRSVRPTRKSLLPAAVSLAGLTAGRSTPPANKRRKKAATKPPARTTVIPKASALDIDQPRINAIHNELLSLTAQQYPNACAVLLRVFIELSVDHFLAEHKLPPSTDDPLAKRLKAAAKKLKVDGAISEQLRRAVEHIADGPSPIAPGVSTLNQYVHNRYTHPKPPELFAAWDELQPLMEKLWP